MIHTAFAIVLLFLTVSSPQLVLAEKVNCSDLLGKATYTPTDYVYSDLAGDFIDFVGSAARMYGVNSGQLKIDNFDSTHEMNVLLKKKASLLNLTGYLIYLIGKDKAQGQDREEMLVSIERILNVLNVSSISMGISNNTEEAKANVRSIQTPVYEPSRGIGYVGNRGSEPTDRKNQSIGFGVQLKEKTYQAPVRSPEDLRYPADEQKGVISVLDIKNNTMYRVPANIIAAVQMENNEARFTLRYSPSEQEWIVAKYNKANPEGRMGF